MVVDTHLYLMEYTLRTGTGICGSTSATSGTVGWLFWSDKLPGDGSNLDGWDLRRSIERGYLPGNLSREERDAEDDSGG